MDIRIKTMAGFGGLLRLPSAILDFHLRSENITADKWLESCRLLPKFLLLTPKKLRLSATRYMIFRPFTAWKNKLLTPSMYHIPASICSFSFLLKQREIIIPIKAAKQLIMQPFQVLMILLREDAQLNLVQHNALPVVLIVAEAFVSDDSISIT